MPLALSVTHSAPSCSEHDLIAAVRRGDDRAFELLYSRYQRRITAYIQGMVGDHGRAEDITQEVFMSVLRRLRQSDRPIVFKPWLYEIAKNACIDEFRRARRGKEVPLEHDDDLIGGNPRLVSRAPTPETAIESKQRLTDLRGAFRGLSEHHHKVIVLRELEGLSYAQIGAQLGMSQAVVESTLFRARRRLGEEYEDLVSGRRCERVRAVVDNGDSRTVRSLGIKERRLIARHLAHCQDCRRHARLAGVDDALFEQPRLVGKIAALLPIPAWLRLRRGGTSTVSSPSHSLGLIQSAQGLMTANPAAIGGMSRAAAAAVTLVVAGAGAGIVTLEAIPGSSNGASTRVERPAAVSARRTEHASSARRTPGAARRTTAHRAPALSSRTLGAVRLGAKPAASASAPLASGRHAASSASAAAVTGSSTPAAPAGARHGGAGRGVLHGAPNATLPVRVKLPNALTTALPGLLKTVHQASSGSVNAGPLSTVVAGSGRGGTATNAPGAARRVVDGVGAAVTSSATGGH